MLVAKEKNSIMRCRENDLIIMTFLDILAEKIVVHNFILFHCIIVTDKYTNEASISFHDDFGFFPLHNKL